MRWFSIILVAGGVLTLTGLLINAIIHRDGLPIFTCTLTLVVVLLLLWDYWTRHGFKIKIIT